MSNKIIITLAIIFLPVAQVFAASVLPRTVTIQPIVLSDNDGSNTATFFGSGDQQVIIEKYIDDIWGQAGIDVDFLSANSWNNSFANNGTSNPRPAFDLHTIFKTSRDVRHENLNFINMFFVNMPAGFGLGDISSNSAGGLAYVGTNGITQFVGKNLLGSTNGQKTIASVVAHEIGHNLGLSHLRENAEGNLMATTGKGGELTEEQIEKALNSRFAVASDVPASNDLAPAFVPVPAAVWLFCSGLIGLASFSRRKA